MAPLHVFHPPARLLLGHILYSWIPQILDPITNPPFGGPWGLPAYTLLHEHIAGEVIATPRIDVIFGFVLITQAFGQKSALLHFFFMESLILIRQN